MMALISLWIPGLLIKNVVTSCVTLSHSFGPILGFKRVLFSKISVIWGQHSYLASKTTSFSEFHLKYECFGPQIRAKILIGPADMLKSLKISGR